MRTKWRTRDKVYWFVACIVLLAYMTSIDLMLVSAAPVTDANGVSFDSSSGPVAYLQGDVLTARAKIVVLAVNRLGDGSYTIPPTTCFLFNSTTATWTDYIANGTFSGTRCDFKTNMSIQANTNFTVAVGCLPLGSNCIGGTNMQKVSGGLPVAGTNANWTAFGVSPLDGGGSSLNSATFSAGITSVVTDLDTLNITNLSPDNNSAISYLNANFSGVFTSTVTNLSNVTFYLNGIKNESRSLTGLFNGTTNFLRNLTIGSSYNWSLSICDISNYCVYSENRTISIQPFTVNSQTYNSSIYETGIETYIINISGDGNPTSAQLIWNGTTYSTTKSGNDYEMTFTKQISIPEGVGTKNVYWNITYNGSAYSTNSIHPIVYAINFSICTGTAPFNVPYVNFTFKDETTGNYLNATVDLLTSLYGLSSSTATKSYIATNTTNASSFPYCFNPGNLSAYVIMQYLQYSGTNYPQRHFYASEYLTNATTNKTLYLLGSSAGIYSTIQVLTITGTPIPNVTISVQREIGGTWTQIEQGSTDSSGTSTFWVNPNYDHRYTASKPGYITTVATIRPTQSIYSIVLSGSSSNATYVSSVEGVYYTTTPAFGIITPGSITFGYNITSIKGNMVNCRFDLTYPNATVIDSTSSPCTTTAYLTLTHTFVAGDKILGKYYVDMGSGWLLLEGDGNWYMIPSNKSSFGTVRDFMILLGDKTAWTDSKGASEVENMKYEFTIIIIVFVMIAIFAAALNLSFSFDLYSPGYFLFILPAILIGISVIGGIQGEGLLYIKGATNLVPGLGSTSAISSINHFLDNFVIAFFSVLISIGIWLSASRRDG